MLKINCWLFLCVFLLNACSSGEPSAPVRPLVEEVYIETGDLQVLAEHGTIRLLAPRFQAWASLPREGFSRDIYQGLAEAFVRAQGLEPEWIYVNSYAELLPALNEGLGDIVVTNLSVTDKRREQAAFSQPVKVVDEVLVSRELIEDLTGFNDMVVAAPQGTAYEETLLQLAQQYPYMGIILEDTETTPYDMLRSVAEGKRRATVIDRDVLLRLLPDFPDLKMGPVLHHNRKIAWAVREANPALRSRLNEFLVSQYIAEGLNQQSHRDWPEIKSNKVLRMLTLNNPASYFLWRGELMGFDYDLVKRFAGDNGLYLSVIVKDDIASLLEALKNGEGDIGSASITATAERESIGIAFSNPYLTVTEQLVGQAGAPPLASLDELAGKSVVVNPETSFWKTLQTLKASVPIELVAKSETTTEDLIELVASGEYDYTLADSHLALMEKTYRQDIDTYWDLTAESPVAWAVRPDQPELLEQLNRYIKKTRKGQFYNVSFEKYFELPRKIELFGKYRVTKEAALSPYDEIVQRHARANNLDWRMVVSQMYQESQFKPKARSFAGARGLMQVMPRTGREMGYSDLYKPENGIAAGIAYMEWLQDRFPGDIPIDQRIYFTLAAYNAGAGHVRDAQKLAAQLGKDPNRWFGNVEDAMLLLSKRQYYRQSNFGYVRGREPVNYVKDIRERYVAYLNVVE